jgi:hypothetical protein
MFFIPGCRQLSVWLGGIDAGRLTAKRALDAGKSLIIYPGGSKEIFKTDPESKETILIVREVCMRLSQTLEHPIPQPS